MARRWQLVLAGAVLLAVAIVAVAVAGRGDAPAPTLKEYQASVVNTRDRVDFAMEQISQAKSEDDFLDRLEGAGTLIDEAADDFDDAGAPSRFEDESEALVEHLHQLAEDLRGTAGHARDFGFDSLLTGAAGLNFPSWDKANATLADLREQGIKVQPIGRH